MWSLITLARSVTLGTVTTPLVATWVLDCLNSTTDRFGQFFRSISQSGSNFHNLDACNSLYESPQDKTSVGLSEEDIFSCSCIRLVESWLGLKWIGADVHPPWRSGSGRFGYHFTRKLATLCRAAPMLRWWLKRWGLQGRLVSILLPESIIPSLLLAEDPLLELSEPLTGQRQLLMHQARRLASQKKTWRSRITEMSPKFDRFSSTLIFLSLRWELSLLFQSIFSDDDQLVGHLVQLLLCRDLEWEF